MLRDILACVAGVAIAFLIVFLADELSHMMYPPPPGLDFSDPEALRPYIATMPIGAFLFILASSIVAAFIGTLVACYIGTIKPLNCAIVVGGIVLAASIANFIAIPHPSWLAIATMAGVVAAAWFAAQLAPASKSEASPD